MMGNTAAEQGSAWRNEFLFLGNQLALDFLNTCPVLNGKPTELLPDFGAVVRWFRAAELLTERDARRLMQQWGQSASARKTAEAIRELREELRAEVLGWESGENLHRSTAERLNSLMTHYPMRTRLKVDSTTPKTEVWFEIRQPEDLFAPLASSAAALFSEVDRSRVRKCDECVLHFYDTSKKGLRRWCSMQFCGNRLKVRAYAMRQRKGRRTGQAQKRGIPS